MESNIILLIDDDETFAKNFTQELASISILVIHKRSEEKMEIVLKKYHHKLAAVILDIKCIIKENQITEDNSFLAKALKHLDQNYSHIPRYILTGDDSEFDRFKDYYTEEKLFLKTPQGIDSLCIQLKDCVENFSVVRLMRENSQVFEIFRSGKMDLNSEQLLIDKILKKGLSEKKFIEFKDICANIRSFQELIYKFINRRNAGVVPNHCFKPNGMIEFNPLMKHLSGNPSYPGRTPTTKVYQNNTICNLSNYIYWSCGEYIHENPNRDYEISDNTIKSLIYGLLELILWAKQY